MKHDIPVWQMVERALRAHGGKATNLQVRDWILRRWPDVPKGTISCQRIICTVNQPSRTGFPENHKPRLANSRYDFMYMPARGQLERYEPRRHGRWEIARVGGKLVPRIVPLGSPRSRSSQPRKSPSHRTPAQSWILVHSHKEFAEGATYQSPSQELLAGYRPGMRWNWGLPKPMRPDAHRRLILFGWNGAVIGEANASITRRIEPSARRKGSNFAFVLHRCNLLGRPIPYEDLLLDDRAKKHRSLIRLTPESLREYRRIRRAQPASRDALGKQQIENVTLGEAGHGQGFGLTAAQRAAVAKRGMELAKQELTRRRFEHIDVSHNSSFDLSVFAGGQHYFVEVKATTGSGRSVFLTANEVDLHLREYPHNVLIVVHGIRLRSSGRATGGTVDFEKGWRLQRARLKPITFRYFRAK